MSNPNLFTPSDRIGTAVVSGSRPFAARPVAKLALAAAFVFSAVAIAPSAEAQSWGQQTNISARVYDSQSTLASQSVETGEIIGIRPVDVRVNQPQRQNSYVGAAAGASLGGLVAAALFGNNYHTNGATRSLAIAAGAIGGGVVGNRIARGHEQQSEVAQALQVFVQFGYGSNAVVRSFVQANDQQGVQIGARVAVVHSRDGDAVTPVNLGQQNQNNNGGYRNTGYRQDDGYQQDDGYSRNPSNDRGDGYSSNGNQNDVQEVIRSNRYRQP